MKALNNCDLHKKLFVNSLAAGNTETINTIGFSMEPTLVHEDKISVKKAKDYMVGDIVVFNYNKEFLVHRIIQFDYTRIYCKGDNALRVECISKDDIIGKVVKINGIDVEENGYKIALLSKKISDMFCLMNYDKELLFKSGLYLSYKQYVTNHKK